MPITISKMKIYINRRIPKMEMLEVEADFLLFQIIKILNENASELSSELCEMEKRISRNLRNSVYNADSDEDAERLLVQMRSKQENLLESIEECKITFPETITETLKKNANLAKLQTEDEQAYFTEEILTNEVEMDFTKEFFHPKDEKFNLKEDNYNREDVICLLRMEIDSYALEIDKLKKRNHELEEERNLFKRKGEHLVEQMRSLQDMIADHNVEMNSLFNKSVMKDDFEIKVNSLQEERE